MTARQKGEERDRREQQEKEGGGNEEGRREIVYCSRWRKRGIKISRVNYYLRDLNPSLLGGLGGAAVVVEATLLLFDSFFSFSSSESGSLPIPESLAD